MSSARAPASDRTYALLGAGAVLIALVLRVMVYAPGLSMHTDELMLALNIGRRSFLDLATPLSYDQAAPVLYLWMVKLTTILGGVNEYSIRFPAFIAGILLPFAVWRVVRRVASEPVAIVATLLVALSPWLILFSAEGKPYGIEALVAVVLASLACDARDQPASARAWRHLALGGSVAMMFSTAAVFSLLACAAFLASNRAAMRSGGWRKLAGTLAVWFVAGLAVYALFLRATAGNAYLHHFWADTFFRLPAGTLARQGFAAFVDVMRTLPIAPELVRPRLLIPVCALGVFGVFRAGGISAVLLCITGLLAAFTASTLGRYPAELRFWLFAAPFTAIILASALMVPLAWLDRRRSGASGLVAFVLIAVLAVPYHHAMAKRPPRGEGRYAIASLTALRGDEPVYVSSGGLMAWTFYRTDWRNPDDARLDSTTRISSAEGVAFHNGASRGHAVRAEESAELTFERGGATEIVGVKTGMQFVAGRGLLTTAPDSGWAAVESARILALCSAASGTRSHRYAWILSAHRVESEIGPLLTALMASGARVVYRDDRAAATAIRVRC